MEYSEEQLNVIAKGRMAYAYYQEGWKDGYEQGFEEGKRYVHVEEADREWIQPERISDE